MTGNDNLVIAVLTYRRPRELAGLLPELAVQVGAVTDREVEIIVVDNDPDASAREVVAQDPAGTVRYVHEPAPGIAHGRNRALAEAGDAKLLVFIDDDERPLPGWLAAMLSTYDRTGAAGVTGPVYPDYEGEPDPWLVAAGIFIRKEYPDGTEMPAAGTGNLLLDLDQVRELGLGFDDRFGLTGGSDTLFTRRLVAAGRRIVYAAAAGVFDKVPAGRMTREWGRQRYFRVGNTWSRTSIELTRGPVERALVRLRLTVLGVARAGFGTLRAGLGLLTRDLDNRARGERAIVRGLGMVTGAWGRAYIEYRRPGSASAVSPLRGAYRRARKAAKRASSHLGLWLLRLRNRFSSTPALGDAPAMVSLTSYGSRIDTVAFTIESIAAGTVRPRRLVLWLDDPERFSARPAALRRLERRGVEVRLTQNLGPHTKYFPALGLALADGLPLVTADDDLLYPPGWLNGLVAAGREHPDVVNCYRASVVALRDGVVAPYVTWPRCKDVTVSAAHFATGVSGVRYPAAMLTALCERGAEFTERCAKADDIWLHWVALRAGIGVRQVSPRAVHFPYLPGTQEETLVSGNIGQGANDRYVAGLYEPDDVARLAGAGAPEV